MTALRSKAAKPTRAKPKMVFLEIVRGVYGLCVYLNGYRIAGDKPWGGGQIVGRWEIPEVDVDTAMRQP